MISSHKSPSYSIIATNNNNNHVAASADKPDAMESASLSTNLIVIPNDDELPVPEPSIPIESIATASESNSSLFVSGGGTTIIENPNLTYKSNAEDIMNMDIIFDNVPIEEDPTIGNNVTILHETTMPAITANNIHYEVIQLDGANRTDPVIQQQPVNYSQYDESSNEGILVIDESVHTPIDCNEIVLDSNGMEIVCSSPPMPSSQDGVTVECSSEQEIVDTRIESVIVQSTIEDGVTVEVSSEQIADESEWLVTVTPPLSRMESDIVQSTPEESEANKAKQTRVRKPKLKIEPAAKPEKKPTNSNDDIDGVATTSALLKRKRKPLPTLIGRSKKSKTEDSQPPIKSDIEAQNETIECEFVADALPAEQTSDQIIEQETQLASDDVDAADDAAVNDDTNESEANDCMDSLVVVESQDPNDASKTIHEVYFVCPETKKMSDQPLDLPDEVIQRIRLSMMPGAE